MPSRFLELAQPDRDGFSRAVSVDEFTGRYEDLRLGNGGSWCRDDSGLGKIFNIHRKKSKNKIIAIELHGFKKNPIEKRIRTDISEKIGKQKCAVLAISSDVQVDHKDGWRDANLDLKKQQLSDFQPLSKAVNVAKRQHCKTCRETHKRFDAKKLGYSVSQVKGNGEYRGTCVGCYWYDPTEFNRLVSQNFNKH